MKQTTIIVVFLLLSCSIQSNAQNVKLKKGKVLLDNQEIMKFERQQMGAIFYMYDLKTDTEVIFIQRKDNETPKYFVDDFLKIYFSQFDIMMEVSVTQYNNKRILKSLVKHKALRPDGTLDKEKVKLFVKKFDENITNRTIR